ncbi:MAG: sulfotransferase [Phycisphaerales bacterium]
MSSSPDRSSAAAGTASASLAAAVTALRNLRLDEAIAAARAATSAHPADARAAEVLSVALVEAGRRDEAIECLRRAVDAGAGAGTRGRLAGQYMAAGAFDAALEAFDAAESEHVAAQERAGVDGAGAAAGHAAGVQGSEHGGDLAGNLAGNLGDGSVGGASFAATDHVRIALVAGRTECLERMGRLDDAVAGIAGSVDGGATPPAIASVAVRVLGRSAPDEAIALGRAVHEAAIGTTADRDPTIRDLRLTLARQLERAGDAAAAFDVAAAAHRGHRAPFDLMAYGRMIDGIIRGFTAERIAATRDAVGVDGTRSIFVVGAPRCGSTLLERMLAQHPNVVGLGEIPAFHRIAVRLAGVAAAGRLATSDAEAAGREYVATCVRLASQAASGARDSAESRESPESTESPESLGAGGDSGVPDAAPHLVNKDLGVLLHAGLASMLLPGATIVHVRREAVDHGLAIWMERLRPSAAPWAADLRHVGSVLRRLSRLSEHWADVLGDRFVTVDYERLVETPEACLRPVLDAAGLPWDPACLDFAGSTRVERTLSYAQARQPLSRASVGRSDLYGARLDPLRRALGRPSWDERTNQPGAAED